MGKLLLVDGHSIINRAFYGVPPLSNSKGTPTNGIYGFMNILYKLIDQERPTHIAVAFDLKAPTFRHKMYPEYKGTRKPMPQELLVQVPVLKDLLLAGGITVMELSGYEADDLIGTMSRRGEIEGHEVIVLSGDRDLFQLITDKVSQYIPRTKSGITTYEVITPETMLETYGVTPSEYIAVKALQGDSSDNIPGVAGIGEKTAQALVHDYHSLDEVFAHIDEIKPARAQNALRNGREDAYLSYKLAEICVDAPLDLDINTAVLGDIYTPEAYEMMGQLELKSLMKRFSGKGISLPAPASGTDSFVFPEPVLEKTNDINRAEEIIEELIFTAKKTHRAAAAFKTVFDEEHLILTADGMNIYDLTLFFMLDRSFAASALIRLSACGRIILPDLAGVLRELDLPKNTACFDTSVAAYLLDPLKNSYSYEDISRDYLGIVLPSEKEVFDKQTVLTIDKPALDAFICRQVSVPFFAANVLEKALKDTGMFGLFTDMEMPTVFALHEMEKEGIRVDKDALHEYGQSLSIKITELEKEIYILAGEEFNINSPLQLGSILFEKLALPGGKKTQKGYSTAADVLEKLAGSHAIVPKVLEYRTYTKLKSTYADGLAAYIGADGRIHGKFLQTVTATGRISSADPNLQNIPVRTQLGRELRKVFIPKDGCIFIDADYSQIELRVLAHLSGDERLIDAYNSAADIHSITASQVFHVPLSEVTAELRRKAKAVNFGIVYGISAFGLSEDLDISRKDANRYIEDYFVSYPGVKAYLDRQVVCAKNNGYVLTDFNRRRPVPELKSSNYMQRQFGERVAMNSPIQGTAADIMKLAMIAVTDQIKARNLKSRVVLQIHDELLLEVPEAEKDEVIMLLKEEMSGVVNYKVKLEIGVETGNSWFETK